LTIQYMNSSGNWVTYSAASPPAVTSTEVRATSSDGRVGRAVPVMQ
jgi:hypothetical protein